MVDAPCAIQADMVPRDIPSFTIEADQHADALPPGEPSIGERFTSLAFHYVTRRRHRQTILSSRHARDADSDMCLRIVARLSKLCLK